MLVEPVDVTFILNHESVGHPFGSGEKEPRQAEWQAEVEHNSDDIDESLPGLRWPRLPDRGVGETDLHEGHPHQGPIELKQTDQFGKNEK